ncbi:unnamed protein product [Paramecium sonneborni]|uniref:Uncharacterized protein n=1 Tax=Paramecium sonneborni TaxID=65129 RepID=A0A8S1PPX0_9CILI|nr:unnamed protein product [Paramecium sonneborni]
MILQPFFKSTTNSYSNANYPINQATNKHQMNKPFIRYFWKILQFKTNSQTQQIINILFMNYPLDIVIRLALGWIKMRKARFSWSIFLQDNYFQLLMYFEQFDPRKKQIIKVPLVFVFDTLSNQIIQNQLILKAGELIMDDGFLFQNSNKFTYLSVVTILSTQPDKEISKKVFGKEIFSILLLSLYQIKMVNIVEYPRISEILADTSSIITWILSISFLVSKYNENICLQKTQNEVISMYYHDYIDFKIQKNWLGKIKRINYKEKEYDPKNQNKSLINQIKLLLRK